MFSIIEKVKRYGIWILICLLSIFIAEPAIEEINTILLILIIETIAAVLSGIAVYAYTQIDLIREKFDKTLASIFLGVHICTGLTVMGVYIAQF